MHDMIPDATLIRVLDKPEREDWARSNLANFKARYGVVRAATTVGPPVTRTWRGQPYFYSPGLSRGFDGCTWDHPRLWFKEGTRRAMVYTCEPYGLSRDRLRTIIDHCDEHGLDIDIEGGSWHFPGRTALVVVRIRRGD